MHAIIGNDLLAAAHDAHGYIHAKMIGTLNCIPACSLKL
jgi:hypothetical protein